MGIYMNHGFSEFMIDQANIEPARLALLDYLGPDNVMDTDFETLFTDATGFSPDLDEEGNVIGITQSSEKYRSEFMEGFEVLAPFVEDGSYIDLEIEYEYYRWRFKNGKMKEYGGRIVYDEDTEG